MLRLIAMFGASGNAALVCHSHFHFNVWDAVSVAVGVFGVLVALAPSSDY